VGISSINPILFIPYTNIEKQTRRPIGVVALFVGENFD